ncbi:winged helix-turn-helix domain-containing protein [Dactylosporangium salmoneum]|uniref:HTH gntR-type domain-containing protein n=1 Tax=Dactylosporangium salmoneum TaxID=53361 RepID=A0ABN3GAI9_9ACTN
MPAEDIGDDRPVWEQVVAGLRVRIAAGKPGDRLPSISELAEEYGVGATTVKMALSALRLSGEIRTKRGQGTYIAGGDGRTGESVTD